VNAKKIILPNLPYVFIALYGTKIGQAVRLAPGNDFSAKALNIMEGFSAAFQSTLPSFHPVDLLVGICIAAVYAPCRLCKEQKRQKIPKRIWSTALPAGARRRTSSPMKTRCSKTM
jgi:type IV secretion system protein VirD4